MAERSSAAAVVGRDGALEVVIALLDLPVYVRYGVTHVRDTMG